MRGLLHAQQHTHTYIHSHIYVYVCVYIYLYRHVQLQKLTKASEKHLDTTTGQPLPATCSKISTKQKIKHRAASRTCCHARRRQIPAPFPGPHRAAPGLSEPLSLHGLGPARTPEPLRHPQTALSSSGTVDARLAPGSPLGAGIRLLPLLGASPRAPHSTASAARQPAPAHPILRQANVSSLAPEHPFGAVYPGGEKQINKERNK